jgi:hypothetical protein
VLALAFQGSIDQLYNSTGSIRDLVPFPHEWGHEKLSLHAPRSQTQIIFHRFKQEVGDWTFVQNVLDLYLDIGTPVQNELACDPEKREQVYEHGF